MRRKQKSEPDGFETWGYQYESLPGQTSFLDSFEMLGDMSLDDAPPREDDAKLSSPVSCPFTILVDSNEQLPYMFKDIWDGDHHVVVKIERKHLPVGDYSIKELPGIVVERKSFEDFISS